MSRKLASHCRVLALAAGLCLLTACPESSPFGRQEPGREPTTIAVMEPDVLFLAPGDTAEARLSITGVAGTHEFEILDVERPRTPEPPAVEDVTFEIVEVTGGASVLRAAIGSTAGPGIHRVPVEFENRTAHGTVRRTRELTVVVMPTDATPTADRVVELAASDTHSLARLEDGSVWAWGRNDYGQIGDGTFTDRQVPVQVAGLQGSAIAIAAGGRHSLALLDDGSLWAWGDNRESQVQWGRVAGDFGASTRPRRLVDTGPNGRFFDDPVAIAAGAEHSVLLNTRGAVHTWGDNDHGQLGDPNRALGAVRVQLIVPARAIAADGDHTVAIGTDDSVWGWGRSDRGQLGAAVNQPAQPTPIDIAFLPDVAGAGLGKDHTLLLLDDGNVGGLGSNSSAQLGDGSLQSPAAQPVRPPRLLNVRAADGGWLHSLALQQDRSVFAWGSNDFGQASDAANTTMANNLGHILQLVPQRVTGVPPSDGIAAGGRHSLSLAQACGSVWSWGDNAVAQLGDGAVRVTRARPEPVYGLGEEIAGCRKVLGLFSRGGEGTITAMTNQGIAIDDADCSESCVTSFELNALVTLVANPAPGNVFMSWSGNVTSAQPTVQVTMDRARNCLAWFASLPLPQFTMTPNPYTPGTDDQVDLDATASSDPDGRIELYQWDIGNDGSIDLTGATARFRPATSPPLAVRLIVTDNDGLTAETVQTLELGTGTPGGGQIEASFYWDPLQPAVGQRVHFGAYASSSPAGPIVEYQWDFENDGVFDATGVMVEHVFEAARSYTVRLRVTDGTGASAETTETVVVVAG